MHRRILSPIPWNTTGSRVPPQAMPPWSTATCLLHVYSCTASSGWMRVSQLDMTDISEHCPSSFKINASPKRHGKTPRQHIWTFDNALDEIQSQNWVCSCTKTDSTYTGVVPPLNFICNINFNDFFCETGNRYSYTSQWYTADRVWDGEGCGGTSTCCEFNSPPWFCTDLPQPTTDDIELRLCSDQDTSNDDTGLEIIELYVQ